MSDKPVISYVSHHGIESVSHDEWRCSQKDKSAGCDFRAANACRAEKLDILSAIPDALSRSRLGRCHP